MFQPRRTDFATVCGGFLSFVFLRKKTDLVTDFETLWMWPRTEKRANNIWGRKSTIEIHDQNPGETDCLYSYSSLLTPRNIISTISFLLSGCHLYGQGKVRQMTSLAHGVWVHGLQMGCLTASSLFWVRRLYSWENGTYFVKMAFRPRFPTRVFL